MKEIKIEIPVGDYEDEGMGKFCQRFNCTMQKRKRGEAHFTVTTDEAINLFWLGCNLNFYYDSGIAISPASQYLKAKLTQKL